MKDKEDKLERIYAEIGEIKPKSHCTCSTWIYGEPKYKPVMIGDCLQYIDDNIDANRLIELGEKYHRGIWSELTDIWKDKRQPIDSEPECIDLMISLIDNTTR